MDAQVGGQGPDPGSVDGWCTGRFGEARLGLAPAHTTPALGDMLGHHESDIGEVEDLAVLGVDNRGAGEPCPAALARHGHMGDDLIRLDDLGQMLPLRAGLLPWLALCCSTSFGPRRRLGKSFGRRRHR